MPVPCHHHGISRLQAEKLLKTENTDGSYLIRDSESIAGAYTLCVWCKGVVHQYRILPDKDKRIFVQANQGVQEKKFTDLSQLIQQYVQRRENNGLVCALKHPVNVQQEEEKESEDEDEEESEDYIDPETKCVTLPSKDDALTSHFHHRFTQLDLSCMDGAFIEDIKKYVDTGLQKDAYAIKCGTGVAGLTEIHGVLANAAKPLEKQLNDFLSKVELLQQLFTQGRTKKTKETTVALSFDNIPEETEEDTVDYDNPTSVLPPKEQTCSLPELMNVVHSNLGTIIERLSCCKTEISSLDKKAVKCLQELSTIQVPSVADEDPSEMKSIVVHPPRRKPIPPSDFTVKLVKGIQLKEVSITLDLNGGKLIIVRPHKEVLDQEAMPTHDKVEQLIKSKTHNCRLDIKIEGRKKETYQFDDARSRENFCQLVHQMKNIHAPADQVDSVCVFIGTWNMGDEQPGYNLNPWLKCYGTGRSLEKSLSSMPHDIYVLGTQESALTEKDWTNKIKTALETLYEIDLHLITVTSLWGLRLIILTKVEHKNKISHVQTSFVRTGIANALGNKGAVGVSFSFLATSFCFVCAHLTSGAEKNNRRNANFRDITKGLSLGNKQLSLFDLTKQFHHLFWLGDLNYRLDEKVEIILDKIKKKDYESLLGRNDQLKRSMADSESFLHFCEEPISFPPTYRFEKGTRDTYAWKKFKKTGLRINVPSWCDRVLWKSYPETYVNPRAYGCVEEFVTSDHKPVFASFEIGVTSQFMSKNPESPDTSDAEIVFEFCEADLITRVRQNFVLEFHSTCLEAHATSKANLLYNQKESNHYCPKWTKDLIPTLKPIVPDRNYLDDQHILVAVKSVDDHESYGECVIAVKPYFSIYPVPFECLLTHQAEETGALRGSLHVRVPEVGPSAARWSKKSRKSYDFVCQEDDTRRNSDNLSQKWENMVFRDRPPCPPPRGQSFNGSANAMLNNQMYNFEPHTLPSDMSLKAHRDNLKPISIDHKTRRVSPTPMLNEEIRGGSLGRKVMLKAGSPTAERPPLLPKDYMCKKEEERIYEDVPIEDEAPPPMPPKRIQSLEMDTYSKIAKPTSIAMWLTQLQIPQYTAVFCESGWDSLAFVNELTEEDLVTMKIDQKYFKRILDSVKVLDTMN